MSTNKRVWNQIAVKGTFLGHPSGPFTLDDNVFSDIINNYKKDGVKIPFDHEHGSEISVADSPAKARGEVGAAGWIHDLAIRGNGLFAEVEWLPKTREQILSGQFKYISPAIRFGSKSGVTGESVGARLSSCAVVLKPFLKSLPEIQASDGETAFLCSEISTEELGRISANHYSYAISSSEYLPKFRSILKLHDLADSDQILDKLDRLEELVEQADGNVTATVDGINLSEYIAPLREFMNMPANTTLSDLLDAVADMVDDNEEQPGVEMADIPSVPTQQQTTPEIAPVITQQEKTPVMETITLSEHTVKLSEAVQVAVKNSVSPLELQVKDLEAKLIKASEDTTLETAKVVALTEQIKTRDAAVAATRVEEAFLTYKETKKLSDDDKEAMAITLSTKPELFEKLYPKLAPAQAGLLRTVTASDTSATTKVGALKVVPELSKIIADLKAKTTDKTYDEIFDMALKEQSTLMAA